MDCNCGSIGEAVTSNTMEAAIESSYLKVIALDFIPDSKIFRISLSFLYSLHILHYTKFLTSYIHVYMRL